MPIGDKFKKTFNAANPTTTVVASPRTAGATTLACDNLTGWPDDTPVDFVTYRLDTDGETPLAGTQIDWEGIVSGNNITSLTRKAGATDTGNAQNDVVEAMPTATWANDLITGILEEHTQTGTHELGSSSTITSSKVITSLNDTNGNELVKVSPTSSAVNEFTIANAATGSAPTLSASGNDTNIDIAITPKGTGKVNIGGNPINHGSWSTWTPTLTNFSIGSGGSAGLVARYSQIGKTINYYFKATLGTSGTSVSADASFSLPVTGASWLPGAPIGNVWGVAGGTFFPGLIRTNTTSVVIIDFFLDDTGSSSQYVGRTATGSNVPNTWGAGDTITVVGTYEAA